MTSALDKNGDRILGSKAGERVVSQVLKGKSRILVKTFHWMGRATMDILLRYTRMEVRMKS